MKINFKRKKNKLVCIYKQKKTKTKSPDICFSWFKVAASLRTEKCYAISVCFMGSDKTSSVIQIGGF